MGVLGVPVYRVSSDHEGFKTGDLFAGTENYEGITGMDSILGRRGSIELTFGAEDGEDHGAGLVSDL